MGVQLRNDGQARGVWILRSARGEGKALGIKMLEGLADACNFSSLLFKKLGAPFPGQTLKDMLKLVYRLLRDKRSLRAEGTCYLCNPIFHTGEEDIALQNRDKGIARCTQ